MITGLDATLLNLTGGVRLKQRVQHPSVIERKDRGQHYWYFRYREDELLPNGTIKVRRKFHTIGPSRGDGALTKKEAEVERDKFLLERNAAPSRCEAAVAAQQPVEIGAILFGKLAELWRKDYAENPMVRLAQPTRDKYRMRLDTHILPRWKDARLADLENSKAVLDWLQHECTSWYMMVDLRNIMSGIITRAQEWGIIPRSFANPMQWVKIGRKWTVREDRILDDDETAAVFARLEDPHLLICETCLDTGTRISEAVGLQLKHFDPKKGTIRIEQRHCRGDVDEPKTKNSKRTLALGTLVDRYQAWIKAKNITRPERLDLLSGGGPQQAHVGFGSAESAQDRCRGRWLRLPGLRPAFVPARQHHHAAGGGRERHRSQQNRGPRDGEPDRRLYGRAAEATGGIDTGDPRSEGEGNRRES